MDFKREIATLLHEQVDSFSVPALMEMLEMPPAEDKGDFAFPCFRLAKTLKKAPALIARDLAANIPSRAFLEKVVCENAYVNFFVDKAAFVSGVLDAVRQAGRSYGSSQTGAGQTVVIDYSSPNVAKPFHVGHLRSTVIGSALYNLYAFLGYTCVGINHLGDWGTQFGKMIVAYQKWGEKDVVEREGVTELNRLYVRYHDEAEQDKTLDDEAREWFVRMQNGDTEALALWQWFTDVSLLECNKIYERLGVRFDAFTGESFYNDKMDAVVEELRSKNLLTESDGAMIVDLSPYNMPPCLILRRDGGTLYPTRDIAAALYRKQTYGFKKCLYVTALDQNLHFSQWFGVIAEMGYDWAADLVHIPFGLVSLESGKLSTRRGNVVLMEDLMNEAVHKVLDIINQKNPSLANKEQVAEQVGIGAIVFHDLYNGRIKDVQFSMDKMTSFEGETGPYVQYTHARAGSILQKADALAQDVTNPDAAVQFTQLTDELSVEVCKVLAQFGDKVLDAANRYEPYIVTRYLVDLAQSFNRFYHENRILSCEDPDQKKARLLVVYAVKTVLAAGLSLLGIAAPEQM